MKAYDIANPKELKALQRRARFKYIDRYTGRDGKLYKHFFKHPRFAKLLAKYPLPPVAISRIALLGRRGWGVLAKEDLLLTNRHQPRSLGIYWGELSQDAPHHSHYIFKITGHEIDAHRQGNWTRFVNHSQLNFNVIALQKFFQVDGRRLPYIEYALIKPVKAGEQLLINYGPEFEMSARQQLFLNPSNADLNFKQLFKQHRHQYTQVKGELLKACRALVPGSVNFYGPTVYVQLLEGRRSHGQSSGKEVSPELPFLQADRRGKLLPDQQQEGLTALMLASYMKKQRVRDNLIKKYAANRKQQNIRKGHTARYYARRLDISL